MLINVSLNHSSILLPESPFHIDPHIRARHFNYSQTHKNTRSMEILHTYISMGILFPCMNQLQSRLYVCIHLHRTPGKRFYSLLGVLV